jgi:hypothetical protein
MPASGFQQQEKGDEQVAIPHRGGAEHQLIRRAMLGSHPVQLGESP